MIKDGLIASAASIVLHAAATMAGSSPAPRRSGLCPWYAWATAVTAVLVTLSVRPPGPEEDAPGTTVQVPQAAPAFAAAPWQCRNQHDHHAIDQVCQP